MVGAAAVILVGAALGTQLLVLGDRRRWAQRARTALSSLRRPATGPRLFVAAIVTGGLVRLLWVIWATRGAEVPADPAEYVRIAQELARADMPTFGGLDHSAFWPPGYPAVLAPFVWLAETTGVASPVFTASLVNVAAGTVTIGLAGIVAGRWLGDRARTPAAWLVALCPALVYFTSTAHTETVFAAVLLGVIALCDVAHARGGGRWWFVVGVAVGAAFLIRTPGLLCLALPACTIRAASGSWRGAVASTGWALLGLAVLLVPWTVRNGVQVGVWSPGSTNNAAALCLAHHDGATARLDHGDLNAALQVACYRGSPYDDRRLTGIKSSDVPEGVTLGDPDEPEWYRTNVAEAVEWAVRHPDDEVRLAVERVWVMWHDEGRAVDGARNYVELGWAGRWHRTLDAAADVWLWVVGILALVALARVRRCRRALPIWVPIALLTLVIAVGPAETHYRYPVVPLVAALAAGLLGQSSTGSNPASRSSSTATRTP